MIHGKKISIVLPAYNAEKTLEKTYNEIPFDIVDQVILVDDFSKDQTIKLRKGLGSDRWSVMRQILDMVEIRRAVII